MLITFNLWEFMRFHILNCNGIKMIFIDIKWQVFFALFRVVLLQQSHSFLTWMEKIKWVCHKAERWKISIFSMPATDHLKVWNLKIATTLKVLKLVIGENVMKKWPKMIPIFGYFIFSKNYNEHQKVAQLVKTRLICSQSYKKIFTSEFY